MINFSLPDAEDENLGSLDIGEGADLPWLETLFVICQIITQMEFLRGDRLLYLFSISIFRRIYKCFTELTSLTLRLTRCIFWVL